MGVAVPGVCGRDIESVVGVDAPDAVGVLSPRLGEECEIGGGACTPAESTEDARLCAGRRRKRRGMKDAEEGGFVGVGVRTSSAAVAAAVAAPRGIEAGGGVGVVGVAEVTVSAAGTGRVGVCCNSPDTAVVRTGCASVGGVGSGGW